jgi:hypothetical protein
MKSLYFILLLLCSTCFAEEAIQTGTGRQEILCSRLSPEEQAFAAKLTDHNKHVFCSKFSAEQRKAAMAAACNGNAYCESGPNAGKRALSPNDAVKKVMKENNISMGLDDEQKTD